MTQTKKSLYFICFLQFIGPILVILGHAKNGLPYNEFLQGMRTFIYILHWPIMLAVRILGYQILHINYIVVAIAMILSGYFIPLAIVKIYHFIKKKFNRDFKVIYYLLGM